MLKGYFSFLRNSALLSGASVLAGLFGYGFQVLVGRNLSVADYATFSTVISVAVFLVSPVNALVMIVTRKVSIISANGSYAGVRRIYEKLLKGLVLVIILAIILWTFFSDTVYSFLNLKSITQYYLTIIIASVSAIGMLNMGVIHGLQQFHRYAALTLLFPILRIVFSLGLILLGYGLYGALIGIIITSLIMFVIGFQSINLIAKDSSYSNISLDNVNSVPIFIASICLTALTQLDVAIVNKFFTSSEAGIFAAVSTLAKSILYLSGGVVAAMYPVIASMNSRLQSTSALFRISFASILIVCGFSVLIFKVFGEIIINFLFGSSYADAGNILWKYAIAIMPMALSILCENYLIAKGSVIFSWLFLVAVPIEILSIYFYGKTIVDVILIIGLCNLAVLLSGLTAMYYILDRSTD